MKLQTTDRTSPQVGEQIVLRGSVQGIGLRPAVARWARECGVSGSVTNAKHGVAIYAEGSLSQVRQFSDGLLQNLPSEANVERIEQYTVPPMGEAGFRIDVEGEANTLSTQLPLDTVICQTCLDEVSDPNNRRSGYAFTNCAICGPRFSILRDMPFSRRHTAMAAFECCPSCSREYNSIAERRFHAETISCPACGPQLWCTDSDNSVFVRNDEAIDVAVKALLAGKIIAVRGIGGYQLLVDATSESAVDRLRNRKRRKLKPLAVMVRSLTDAERIAELDDAERSALASSANPIVVVRQRKDRVLARGINPDIGTIGLMLASTPLHWLLLDGFDGPLVATSGNSEGNPIEYEVSNSQRNLAEIADLWLHHDREILHPIDDSVVRVTGNRSATLRLGRGLGPLSIDLDALRPAGAAAAPPMLAVGGQMKAAIAIFGGTQSVLGPHIGELEGANTRERWIKHVAELCWLYGIKPELLVCDQHPSYFTTDWVRQQEVLHETVQHHHAHIVAAMVEHQWLDREVLGFAFDGTGYGPDGTVWGGEVLKATAEGFKRVAHLRPIRLAGGEAAVRQPWRVAVELVREAVGIAEVHHLAFADVAPSMIEGILGVFQRDRFSPKSTSMGRLFDGVAALVLGTSHVDFEAQASIQLESRCELSERGQYKFLLQDAPCLEIDWRPVVRAVCDDRRHNVTTGVIAMRFHRAVANMVVAVAESFPSMPVALGGGVFQNRVLTELVAEQWPTSAPPLGLPSVIPAGDGGLAVGQLAVAKARYYRRGV